MSLVLDQVTKRFGSFLAVDQLSLTIPEKQMFGMLGANGAGKTTTFRMILGLLGATEGNISWDGQPITYNESHLIGYLPEERGLYPKLKIRDQLIYLGKLRGMTKKQVEKQLAFWLEKFNVPDYIDKKIEELSKGNQQKIQFIAAVMHDPKLLILDEPFSGLDPVNVELLKKAVIELRDNGTSILFSSHRMEHVEELCENLCILHKGKPVVSGALKDIKESYGRKNVTIEADFDLSYLKEIAGVKKWEKTPLGAMIQVEEEKVTQELLGAVTNKGFVTKFTIEEPTLNEIFIERVGAGHE